MAFFSSLYFDPGVNPDQHAVGFAYRDEKRIFVFFLRPLKSIVSVPKVMVFHRAE